MVDVERVPPRKKFGHWVAIVDVWLEARRALLQKAENAFGAVGRRVGVRQRLGLDQVCELGRRRRIAPQHVPRQRRHHRTALRRNRLRDGERRGEHVGARHHVRKEAAVGRVARAKHAAGEAPVERTRLADEARQQRGAAALGRQPAPDKHKADFGVGRHHAHVLAERHRDADANGVAVDRRHAHFAAREHRQRHAARQVAVGCAARQLLFQLARQHHPLFALAAAPAVQALQICAGTERIAARNSLISRPTFGSSGALLNHTNFPSRNGHNWKSKHKSKQIKQTQKQTRWSCAAFHR